MQNLCSCVNDGVSHRPAVLVLEAWDIRIISTVFKVRLAVHLVSSYNLIHPSHVEIGEVEAARR